MLMPYFVPQPFPFTFCLPMVPNQICLCYTHITTLPLMLIHFPSYPNGIQVLSCELDLYFGPQDHSPFILALYPHTYILKPSHFSEVTNPRHHNSQKSSLVSISHFLLVQIPGDRQPTIRDRSRYCSQAAVCLPPPFSTTSSTPFTSLPSSNILYTPSTTSPNTFSFHSLTSIHHHHGSHQELQDLEGLEQKGTRREQGEQKGRLATTW